MEIETGGNPYLEMLKRVRSNLTTYTTTTSNYMEDHGLGGVDCPICNNSGYIITVKDGYRTARECECLAKRRSLRRIRLSGMSDMLERYSFQTYQTPDASRVRVKVTAEKFSDADEGWFFIAGQSGSGKTHICTAICSTLIDKGKEVYYMRWRDESRLLKAIVNSEEIEAPLDKLKTVSVLYIDDFFKGGCNEADIRLAFEILNARYNDSKLRTIISSEIGIEAVLHIDEALGGRIYERSKGFCLQAPNENWRLK